MTIKEVLELRDVIWTSEGGTLGPAEVKVIEIDEIEWTARGGPDETPLTE